MWTDTKLKSVHNQRSNGTSDTALIEHNKSRLTPRQTWVFESTIEGKRRIGLVLYPLHTKADTEMNETCCKEIPMYSYGAIPSR